MTDRELLELAAKGAGICLDNGIENGGSGNTFDLAGNAMLDWHNDVKWNPLTDDGDAFRLAVKLGLTVTPNYHVEQASIGVIAFTEIEDTADYCAPTRRAIVRAAAEIGSAK